MSGIGGFFFSAQIDLAWLAALICRSTRARSQAHALISPKASNSHFLFNSPGRKAVWSKGDSSFGLIFLTIASLVWCKLKSFMVIRKGRFLLLLLLFYFDLR